MTKTEYVQIRQLTGQRVRKHSNNVPATGERSLIEWVETDTNGVPLYPYAWIWDSANNRWISEIQEIRLNLGSTATEVQVFPRQPISYFLRRIGYRLQPTNTNGANEIQIGSTVFPITAIAQNATGVGFVEANTLFENVSSLFVQLRFNGGTVTGSRFGIALELFYIRT